MNNVVLARLSLRYKVSRQWLCTTASAAQVPANIPSCDHKPSAYKGINYDEMRKVRQDKLSPALNTYYSEPLLIHEGHMQWLFDQKGRRYLDLFGGIVTVSVGHCHPKVVEAAEEQMKKLWHTTNIYMHPKIHEYAECLTNTLPGELKVVYFVNSGSEANDLAMMMARVHTGSFDIVTLRNSYHGASPYSAGLTAHGTWKFPFANGFGIHHAANPDPYRGLWGGYRDSVVQSARAEESCLLKGGSECSSAQKYVDQLEEVLTYSVPRGSLAAFFAESIHGVGGTVQYPLGYLKKAFERVRAYGGLCVSDEVQTGFGRTGDHFWCFEDHGVVPDIVTMAKGIGNGFPLAAVVTTPAVAASMSKALHFNTFGGNPLASAVGIAVLDAIEEDGIQKNCQILGPYFLTKLAELRDKYPIVGDVRGKGLMLGVELVDDKETRTPVTPQQIMQVWDGLRDCGVLVGRGGHYGQVLRIKPPMCITKEDIDFTLEAFEMVLDQVCE